MNPEIETNLNQIVLETIIGAKTEGAKVYAVSRDVLGKSIDFVSEQAPLMVEELLRWHFWQCFFHVGVWIGIALVCLYLSRTSWVYARRENDSDSAGISIVLGVAAGVILFFTLIFGGTKLIKIKIAPRVYLIEYVASTLKK